MPTLVKGESTWAPVWAEEGFQLAPGSEGISACRLVLVSADLWVEEVDSFF